jgi:hypothetical protein
MSGLGVYMIATDDKRMLAEHTLETINKSFRGPCRRV